MAFSIVPSAIADYRRRLEQYQSLELDNEQTIRQAFFDVLQVHGESLGWTLAAEHTNDRRKRPDGTMLDSQKLARGHWEAKDTKDDFEHEVNVKLKQKKYPSGNIIFENSKQGLLYQNGRLAYRADLEKEGELHELLTRFFTFSRETIEDFHVAVDEFKERIPELATALRSIIHDARATTSFQTAFDDFKQLCQTSINPNISAVAVEEMLVQHLLTERIFSNVMGKDNFARQNVIAKKIEDVIDKLTEHAFSRSRFFESVNYFYSTLEDSTSNLHDFHEKQGLLNTIYERFFQGFSQDQADTHGIVYTPQPLVRWMIASVDAVLQQEFGTKLAEPDVSILDPAVGTGNFIVNIIEYINQNSPSRLPHKYQHELFCNEVMLLPYYIASLNIERAFFDLAGKNKSFEGIAFVDTLDSADAVQGGLFVEENTERVERQKQTPIKVIIGNPPYNVGQVNENDNNKNRQYPVIDEQVRQTYAKASKATNRNALSDVYVKFFRWATDRLGERDGVVCFVTNNSFVDSLSFDGFRKHLLEDFNEVYHLDLGGNARKGKGGNVFGIMVSVGITIAIRNSQRTQSTLRYYRVSDKLSAKKKLTFLAETEDVSGIDWQTLEPDNRHTWLTEGLEAEFDDFLPMGTKATKAAKAHNVEAIFKEFSNGVKTNRDAWVYNFKRDVLIDNVQHFVETYNSEVDRWKRSYTSTEARKVASVDDFVTYEDSKIKWSRDLKLDLKRENYAEFEQGKVRTSLYRPFCKQNLFLDRILNEEVYIMPLFFPVEKIKDENIVICVSGLASNKDFQCLVANVIPCLDLLEKTQCFPFYTYDEDGSNRRENITDWALGQFREAYGQHWTKWDVFYYCYALLHHPDYRERYAQNLKRDLPRLPLISGADQLATLGKELCDLHLNYETAERFELTRHEKSPFSWRVEKMKLNRDKTELTYNKSLTLTGIPPQCFDYVLGNRSALEWVIDQYRVKTDKRSGIVNDPNNPNDEEAIFRLVEQVVWVSLETVKRVQQIEKVELD